MKITTILIIIAAVLVLTLLFKLIWKNMDATTRCEMNELYCGEKFNPEEVSDGKKQLEK